MPKRKRGAKPRNRARNRRPPLPSLSAWLFDELRPLLHRPSRPLPRSAEHLRNAAIEVLEAMRVCLDEAIVWLKSERAPALKRIQVKD
jgi:hypothetical protein